MTLLNPELKSSHPLVLKDSVIYIFKNTNPTLAHLEKHSRTSRREERKRARSREHASSGGLDRIGGGVGGGRVSRTVGGSGVSVARLATRAGSAGGLDGLGLGSQGPVALEGAVGVVGTIAAKC